MKNTRAVEVSIHAVSPALTCMPTSSDLGAFAPAYRDHRSSSPTRPPEIARTTTTGSTRHLSPTGRPTTRTIALMDRWAPEGQPAGRRLHDDLAQRHRPGARRGP